MFAPRTTSRLAGPAAAALLLVLLIPTPASARLDENGSGGALQYPPSSHCPMERIGDQLVRCDTLTGTGADAPAWVPEW